MVRFLSDDTAEAQALLAAHGVQLVSIHELDEQVAVLGVLPATTADVRADVVLAAPDEASADSGMGAWHINNEHEAHTVLEGVGVIEFWCGDRAVAALLEPGDIMLVQGAEHRYRPLTAQRWQIRYSGGPDAELTATDTGRPSVPWPSVSVD